jgi:mono/diheme cytochrome c family protein
MSRRGVRLILVPAILLALVSATVFALARWHPARSESRAQTIANVVTEVLRGEEVFAENCARCHGETGEGGGIGPRLAGNDISIAEARATIENGSGVMPAALVAGQDLEDVLAYLETIFAP